MGYLYLRSAQLTHLIRFNRIICIFVTCKEKLITGIKVTQQMSKARNILNNQVIPKEELFQIRKKEGKLSRELISALKSNA